VKLFRRFVEPTQFGDRHKRLYAIKIDFHGTAPK
jgi:hypothetical protein